LAGTLLQPGLPWPELTFQTGARLIFEWCNNTRFRSIR
jgi:hypothetical protein